MARVYEKPIVRNIGNLFVAQGECASGLGVVDPTKKSCTVGNSASDGKNAGSCATGVLAYGNPGGQSCRNGSGVL